STCAAKRLAASRGSSLNDAGFAPAETVHKTVTAVPNSHLAAEERSGLLGDHPGPARGRRLNRPAPQPFIPEWASPSITRRCSTMNRIISGSIAMKLAAIITG